MLVLGIGLSCRIQRGDSDGGMQVLDMTAFGNRSIASISSV